VSAWGCDKPKHALVAAGYYNKQGSDGEVATMPAKEEMPSTLQRSPKKARRTWAKTHDSAVGQYGEGERAHRTAFASLKHSFEKVGDHWEEKEGGKKGPSDPQAAKGGTPARRGGRTAGGIDANATKEHLMQRARELGVKGRSRMSKSQLVEALQKASNRETAKARSKG
jgi:ChaB/Rho termination factor, N-terminal domain